MKRPETRTAINEPLLRALDEAIASVEQDKEIRAVVVRGAGKSFCAGLDLAEAERLEGPGPAPVNLIQIFKRLENLPTPTIAAGHCAALAGGCELAPPCELRIAGQGLPIGMSVARVAPLVPYQMI